MPTRSGRWSCALLAGVTAALSASAGPTGPVRLSKAEAARVTAQIEKDRAQAQAWLQHDPASYLAAVARKDFGSSRALTVGSAADNDVRVDASGVAARHLRVTVEGDAFRVQATDPSASFTVKDQDVRDATVGPSTIGLGRLSLRLSHQGFPAIIVFDPGSPHFKEYKGLKYFPVDLSYRFELPLTTNPEPDTIIVMSTRGNQRRALRIGWCDFLVGGRPYRLEAVRLLEPGTGEDDLSVFFRDATSGKDTYGLGRYVDLKKLSNGLYLLDFNAAYNPACGFSDHYNCPVPSKANTLPVAIRAGEMDAHYH